MQAKIRIEQRYGTRSTSKCQTNLTMIIHRDIHKEQDIDDRRNTSIRTAAWIHVYTNISIEIDIEKGRYVDEERPIEKEAPSLIVQHVWREPSNLKALYGCFCGCPCNKRSTTRGLFC